MTKVIHKLQASDIAGFAGHGLKLISPDAKTILEVRGIDAFDNDYIINDNYSEEKSYCDISYGGFKPLLFSPDILTQTITFRGKQVCHLIELAKISRPGLDWQISKNGNCILHTEDGIYYFLFHEGSFVLINPDGSIGAVLLQDKLFAYLDKALVDYMGLGERGLCEYVDLENNNVYAK